MSAATPVQPEPLSYIALLRELADTKQELLGEQNRHATTKRMLTAVEKQVWEAEPQPVKQYDTQQFSNLTNQANGFAQPVKQTDYSEYVAEPQPQPMVTAYISREHFDKAFPTEAQPCDAGEMCLDCQPRVCPDAHPVKQEECKHRNGYPGWTSWHCRDCGAVKHDGTTKWVAGAKL